jgi:hypothetical protein
MTDRTPIGPRRGRGPGGTLRLLLCGLAALGVAAALSSCGASAALGSAVLAPLSALPETDVVMETNLQTAVQGGIAASGISAVSGAANPNVPEVSGPPTSENVVSVGTGATGVSVYSAFNPLDKHCLGTLVLAPGSVTTVLGESTAGSYDFWFGPTTSTACTASSLATEATVPKGWATGDPSSTGWPLP